MEDSSILWRMGRDRDPDETMTYALLRLLFDLADATNAEIADVLAELGLTHALANAVWLLDPEGPTLSMRQIAGQLRCDPSTVTFLADRLEQLGFAERVSGAGDRRTKVLSLTKTGRAARRRLVEAATMRTPIARLDAAEQRCLHALLVKAIGQDDERDVARRVSCGSDPLT